MNQDLAARFTEQNNLQNPSVPAVSLSGQEDMLISVFISPPTWDTPNILLQQFFQAPQVFIENICQCFWRHSQQLLRFLISGAFLSFDC